MSYPQNKNKGATVYSKAYANTLRERARVQFSTTTTMASSLFARANLLPLSASAAAVLELRFLESNACRCGLKAHALAHRALPMKFY